MTFKLTVLRVHVMKLSSTPGFSVRLGLTRRRFLRNTLATGAACSLPAPFSILASSAKRRRNVLFIAVDDLMPRFGCYGRKDMVTPHMDALAGAGCLFERAYCQQAVSSPSRTSLMTGWRPDTTGIYDLQTHFRTTVPNAVTVAETFKQNGYETEALGKIFHAQLDDPQSWSTPWNPSGTPPEKRITRAGGYVTDEGMRVYRQRQTEMQQSGRSGLVLGLSHEIQDVPDDQQWDYHLATAAVSNLERHAKDGRSPFFMAVGFRKPHLPFIAPRKYWDLYPEDAIRLDDNPLAPDGAPEIALHQWGELRAYPDIPAEGPLPDDLARTLIRGYCACTSLIDAQVGRLTEALKQLSLWENTLVVLWGDHGFHLGDKGLWCKHSNFETAVHAPLIIRSPDLPALSSPGLAEFVDIYPTLCDLAEIRPPDSLEGDSLVDVLSGRRPAVKDAAFSQYPRQKNMGYSMRTDRYR
ncbi:MAG: sulfatase, partial [Kiritimatiellia bacterium]|nr:sulfatase [Kiritimatiellia bacterium]